MPDSEYGGGSYNSGYGSGDDGYDNPRAGDTPGFGTGGGGGVGGGGGYGSTGNGPAGPGSGGGSGNGPFSGREANAGYSGPVSRSGMDATNQNITASQTGGDIFSQGRGSNVTDARPVSPVERSSGVGPGGAVNAGGASPTIPMGLHEYPSALALPGLSLFTNPHPVAPATIGVPTINLNMPNNPYGGAFVGQNVRNFMNPTMGIGTEYYGNTGQVSSGALYQSPQPAGFSQPLSAEVRKDYLNWLERESGLPPDSLVRQHGMEVGSTQNPDTARSPTGALGSFQFTRGTAKNVGLINPLTGEDMRTDFIQSADAAARLNVSNAQGLASFLGRQPTAAEVSIAYQQGLGGAKALLGNPNLTAKEALTKAYGGDSDAAERAIKVNNGNPDAPASQFVNKLTSSYNAVPTDLTKFAAYRSESPSNITEAGSPFTGKTYTLDTMPRDARLAGGDEEAVADAARRAAADQGQEGVVGPAQGGRKEAAQIASSSPQSFGDWLDSLFGTPNRIQDLEAQGRYAAMDKQQYADQFTGGDPSKVQSRIVDFGQGPVVDYYAKGLGQAFGEAFTSPFKAVGDLFNQKEAPRPPGSIPNENVTAAKAASESPSDFGAWLSGIFDNSAQVKALEAQGRTATYAGENPEDIKQWYADQYADGDVSKVKSRVTDFGQGPVVDYYVKDLGTAIGEGLMSPFKAVGDMFGGSSAASSTGIKSLGSGGGNSPDNPPRPPADIPNKTPPEEPNYTTGMNLSPRVYSGNPLVAYNYDLISRGYSA